VLVVNASVRDVHCFPHPFTGHFLLLFYWTCHLASPPSLRPLSFYSILVRFCIVFCAPPFSGSRTYTPSSCYDFGSPFDSRFALLMISLSQRWQILCPNHCSTWLMDSLPVSSYRVSSWLRHFFFARSCCHPKAFVTPAPRAFFPYSCFP